MYASNRSSTVHIVSIISKLQERMFSLLHQLKKSISKKQQNILINKI